MKCVVSATIPGAVEVPENRRERARGLLGRTGIDGAMIFPGVTNVHTARMRFAIDVAFLDEAMTVLRIVTLAPWRISPLVRGTRGILECEAGRLADWNVKTGTRLELPNWTDLT